MNVIDTDARFVIDPVSGEITNQSLKETIARGSHNSEVFTFEIPRNIGHDPVECNLIEIHYLNINARNKTETSEGIYKVNDIHAEDDATATFTWTIDGSASVFAGTLSFSIHFKRIDSEGKCLYRLPIKTYSKITVTDAIDNSGVVMEDNKDIIAEWEARITALEENGGGSNVLTEAQASAQLGNELITANGWTTTGWTGSFAEGFTNTSGNTNPLVFTPPAGATLAGNRYQISFACSEEISTTSLKVRIGNSELFELYGQFSAGRWNGVGITAVDNSPLEFVPSSTFTGRIYDISVKAIIAPCEPYFEVQNEAGSTAFAMRLSDPATDNMFLGTEAGSYITSGTNNVGIGLKTLKSNTSGFWNVAIGSQTLENNDVGSRNVGIGHVALLRNTTGHRNIAIGTFAMPHNTTGHHNIAIGADCMDLNETGYNQVAIGFGALRNALESYNNVAIGYAALQSNTGGFGNTGLGAFAGYGNTTGNEVTAIGRDALYNSKGHYNTAVGSGAGKTNTTGIRNTYIGRGADATVNWASDSVAIGCNAKVSKSNQVVIGSDTVTETIVKGNLVVRGTDGVLRQIVFNEDGTVGWVTV